MICSVRGHDFCSPCFCFYWGMSYICITEITLLNPNSFIICFIRKADLSLIVREEQICHERNAFIQHRVLMFLISHSCCWDSEEAAMGAEGKLLKLNVSSSKNCWAKETQSSFSYWIWKPQPVSMTKPL